MTPPLPIPLQAVRKFAKETGVDFDKAAVTALRYEDIVAKICQKLDMTTEEAISIIGDVSNGCGECGHPVQSHPHGPCIACPCHI